jgi:hypothetical protein
MLLTEPDLRLCANDTVLLHLSGFGQIAHYDHPRGDADACLQTGARLE